MWALGVMVYRLFMSKFPFDHEYKSEMIEQIQNNEPEYDLDDDTLLNDFLKHLLEKDPKCRLSAV